MTQDYENIGTQVILIQFSTWKYWKSVMLIHFLTWKYWKTIHSNNLGCLNLYLWVSELILWVSELILWVPGRTGGREGGRAAGSGG